MSLHRARHLLFVAVCGMGGLVRVCFAGGFFSLTNGNTCAIMETDVTQHMFLERRGAMPPRFKFTRDDVVQAAVAVVRENGATRLTARALAAKLQCSVKPIFGLFANMEEVRRAVIDEAAKVYAAYAARELQEGRFPPYKCTGMAYVRFAAEERELFKLLYMRDRTGETPSADDGLEETLKLVQRATGLDREHAYFMHLETWIYVHGIASMIATGYLKWDMTFVDHAVTDCFAGLKERFLKGDAALGRHSDGEADKTV